MSVASIPPGAPPHVAMAYSPPSPPWTWTKGILKTLWLLFFLSFLPYELGQSFAGIKSGGLSVISGWPVQTLVILGAVVALLSGARTIARPSLRYGPVWLAHQLAKVAYLLVLASGAFFGVAFSNSGTGGSVVLNYSGVIYLFMIGTVIATIAALVGTVEDLKHPGERLPFDFPVKR